MRPNARRHDRDAPSPPAAGSREDPIDTQRATCIDGGSVSSDRPASREEARAGFQGSRSVAKPRRLNGKPEGGRPRKSSGLAHVWTMCLAKKASKGPASASRTSREG